MTKRSLTKNVLHRAPGGQTLAKILHRSKKTVSANAQVWIKHSALLALLGAALLNSRVGHAATVSQDLVFSASGQSIWQNGAGGSIDYNGFIGPTWNNVGGSIGGVSCRWYGCYGAEASLNTSGRAGLAYSLQATSGLLSITFPEQVTFSTPDPGAIAAGNAFTITANVTPATTITLQSGGVAKASLVTTGPSVQASLTLQAQATLTAAARGCFAGCIRGSTTVSPSFSQSLLQLDSTAGTLSVLGNAITQTDGGFAYTAPGGVATITARVPVLNTDSAQGGTATATNVTSTVRANAVGVNVSLDKILTSIAGLPPLNGSIGPIGYGLLTATAGATLDVQQSFNFTPNLGVALSFTAPQALQNADGSFGTAAATTNLTLAPGANIFTFKGGNVASLGVSPVFTLNNTTTNDTSLLVAGGISLQAGSLNAFGKTLGPLVSVNLDLGTLPPVSVNQSSFSVNIPTISATPFNIGFGPGAVTASAGFGGATSSIGGGEADLVLVADLTGLTKIYEVFDLNNLISTNKLLIGSGSSPAGACAMADGLGSGADGVELLCSPTGSPIGTYLSALTGVTYVGSEAAQTTASDGSVVFYDGSSAATPTDNNVIVENTTANDLTMLASLGFVPGADDADTPTTGLPELTADIPLTSADLIDVPEPPVTALFLMAGLMLFGLRQLRTVHPVREGSV